MCVTDCWVAEVQISGHGDIATLQLCPRVRVQAMWTCWLENRLQGEGEDAMVVSRRCEATRYHQTKDKKRLARASNSKLESSGDHTRRQDNSRPSWISKKRAQKWLYTSRNWHKAPAPWFARRHCAPWPRRRQLGSSLARHCQHDAKSKPPHHGSDHRE